MNQYELLVDEAYNNGIEVIEKRFNSRSKGLCKNNKLGISKDIPTLREKTCVLAEELGHYYKNVGNIVNLKIVDNKKQEYHGRLWGFNKRIGLTGIIKAFNAHCTTLYDMAEFLDVTEEFLSEALNCYKSKFGTYIKVDNYIISFEPCLSVLKMF
ncbi:hypothetical protein [Anaerocolumna sp. MB42-C2]|uniref:hypothetical protein n=1 Tax=Anaerocolumna sp. MB42-C2 TaxID=3070997 RepID=UPI0027E10C1E|nr:hypothetical protein [Anaerocolumna sp. MB42-C2]WMJ85457.1 hypothetical protein RBU59_15410 [Anaerocolumna sp. MB42-C2]